MAKSKIKWNQEMAIRGANRRLFARSPLVLDKLNESRQEFPRYKKDGTLAKRPWVKRQCEVCGDWVSSTKISIDHIDPVVPPDGFPSHFEMWDRIILFLKRLWCEKSNLQRICDTCHDKKTHTERIDRLYKKYSNNLDIIERTIEDALNNQKDISQYKKAWIKELSRFTSKRSTKGLEKIVERANILKKQIKETQ